MKVSIFKPRAKNLMGEYTAQIDFGETQIQIITPDLKERNRLLKLIKPLMKP